MTIQNVDWAISPGHTPYEAAVSFMESRATAIADGDAPELVWLLEHPPLYTAGTSARSEDLLSPNRFPVHATGRGGEYTYHGPGQRVAYVMLDLSKRGRDVRKFVNQLEQWLIETAAAYDVVAGTREGRVGVWVDQDNGHEDKVAAIGIRLRRWVSFHGIAFNIAPNLEHFEGITPCGISNPNYGVTSLAALGKNSAMETFDFNLRLAFGTIFGPSQHTSPPRLDLERVSGASPIEA
jgi:lipoyl(octanoyl) transferase